LVGPLNGTIDVSYGHISIPQPTHKRGNELIWIHEGLCGRLRQAICRQRWVRPMVFMSEGTWTGIPWQAQFGDLMPTGNVLTWATEVVFSVTESTVTLRRGPILDKWWWFRHWLFLAAVRFRKLRNASQFITQKEMKSRDGWPLEVTLHHPCDLPHLTLLWLHAPIQAAQ
jgi:hypothetical protein